MNKLIHLVTTIKFTISNIPLSFGEGNVPKARGVRLLICLLIFSILLSSCSQPDFRPLEPSVKNGIVLEAKFWKGTFDPNGGFELRLINGSNAPLISGKLTLDDKYEHSVNGLYSREKGLVKDSVMRSGDTLTFRFDEEINNAEYFKIEQKFYFPKTIGLKASGGIDMKWNFEK